MAQYQPKSEIPNVRAGNKEETLKRVMNYLYMQNEQLRYMFGSLGVDNFAPSDLETLEKTITEPISIRLADDEGRLASVELTATGLLSWVSDADGRISTLSQTASGLTASVGNINSKLASTYLTLTTAGLSVYNGGFAMYKGTPGGSNNTKVFYIDSSGNVVMNGGTITGAASINVSTDITVGSEITLGTSGVYNAVNFGRPGTAGASRIAKPAGGGFHIYTPESDIEIETNYQFKAKVNGINQRTVALGATNHTIVIDIGTNALYVKKYDINGSEVGSLTFTAD